MSGIGALNDAQWPSLSHSGIVPTLAPTFRTMSSSSDSHVPPNQERDHHPSASRSTEVTLDEVYRCLLREPPRRNASRPATGYRRRDVEAHENP
jgi:hypothetical protein